MILLRKTYITYTPVTTISEHNNVIAVPIL